jgi:dipeptidyl aminopeptidase/acylaminoacyl peptidase
MSDRTGRPAAPRAERPQPGGPDRRSPLPGHRRLTFVAVAVVCLLALVAHLVVQKQRDAAAASAAAEAEAGRTRLDVDDVLGRPHYVVRNTQAGPSYGKLALVPLDAPSGPRAVVDVACERVAATTSGAVCLQAVPGLVTSYRAVFLDEELHEVGTQPLGGVPSRARMSADGRYAASTVFVTGHAYTDAQFSTETVITELATQTSLGNLETWRTLRNGEEESATDRNYWGVTFVGDGPAFYATLGTGGRRYLVQGDVAARTMTVLGPEGACPSVSPDAATVVYKQQDPESRNDHFAAMDVASGKTVPLSEGRLVDDQVAWADSATVLYAVGKGVASSAAFDVWSSPVDGGRAALVIPDAASPSVVIPEG